MLSSKFLEAMFRIVSVASVETAPALNTNDRG